MGRVAHAILMFAVDIASVSGVERALAAGASVNGMPSIDLVPPIVLASNRGHADIVELLVRRGADLEIATGDGYDSTVAVFAYFNRRLVEIPLRGSRALRAANSRRFGCCSEQAQTPTPQMLIV